MLYEVYILRITNSVCRRKLNADRSPAHRLSVYNIVTRRGGKENTDEIIVDIVEEYGDYGFCDQTLQTYFPEQFKSYLPLSRNSSLEHQIKRFVFDVE